MSDEIRRIIDEELPSGTTPARLDVDDVVHRGRRARRRRVAGYGTAGALLSMVVVAAMVFTLTPLIGDSKATPVGDGRDESKLDVDEPVVDPDEEYLWESASGRESDQAAAYSEAFWEHFSQRYPDAVLMVDTPAEELEESEGDPVDTAFLLLSKQRLVEAESFKEEFEPDAVSERIVLDTYERFGPGEDDENTGCCGMVVRYDGDDEVADGLQLQVLPKGAYTKRTDDIMDPTFCARREKCRVDNVTGPRGQDMQYVTETSGSGTVARSTVVFRDDGSAVVVRADSGPEDKVVSDELNHEDLRDIALALPERDID